jgi:hypothetical protein
MPLSLLRRATSATSHNLKDNLKFQICTFHADLRYGLICCGGDTEEKSILYCIRELYA